MWIALAVAAALIVGALVYLATLDGNYQVRRSLEIDAPVDTVFAAVVDFKSWPSWSPWLMHEPDTRIEYSDGYDSEGGYYSWDGKVVGAGRLTHVSIQPKRRINQQIEFLRPFKSINEVNWEFEEHGNTTLVTWEMVGRMPFLFRFMTKRMEPMIGRDYDLGLALLNGYLNADAPHPTLAFVGRESLGDFSYWSVPCKGNLRQLEATRRSAVESLRAAAKDTSGLAFTLYHHQDALAAEYDAEIGIPISERTPSSNYTRRDLSGGAYFKMTLHGDHRFLPLAWYALESHCRMHKIKLDGRRPALEIYHDDADTTEDSNRLLTALYIATG